jgi:hypothetical protein
MMSVPELSSARLPPSVAHLLSLAQNRTRGQRKWLRPDHLFRQAEAASLPVI